MALFSSSGKILKEKKIFRDVFIDIIHFTLLPYHTLSQPLKKEFCLVKLFQTIFSMFPTSLDWICFQE